MKYVVIIFLIKMKIVHPEKPKNSNLGIKSLGGGVELGPEWRRISRPIPR